MTTRVAKRWRVAFAGTFLHLFLGTVYAWSFFQKPLMDGYHWNNTQVSWVFSLTICFLGLAAAWGGVKLPHYGPRRLAVCGGVLFGTGYLVAAGALMIRSLPLLYLGCGVVGGVGLGLGYVTSVSAAAKWFPDRKGFVTGMVVMGFGLGAMLMSKLLAPLLMALAAGNLVAVFAVLGVTFLMLVPLCGLFLTVPPEEVLPTGAIAPRGEGAATGDEAPAVRACLLSGRFLLMWGVFFCNIVAGISIIGFQSPLLQDLLRRGNPAMDAGALASAGATLIAASSLFNGMGRFLWGSLSDRIGRIQALRLMLGTQVVAFLILSQASSPWLFGALACYILLCYGGGFGTMPSFVSDVFGTKAMPVVYGVVLTAWSAGGIVGPQVVAWMKDYDAPRAGTLSFLTGACFLAVGLGLAMRLSNSPFAGVRTRAEGLPGQGVSIDMESAQGGIT